MLFNTAQQYSKPIAMIYMVFIRLCYNYGQALQKIIQQATIVATVTSFIRFFFILGVCIQHTFSRVDLDKKNAKTLNIVVLDIITGKMKIRKELE